ncbi:tRNA amidotransferase [Vibrio phage pVp-1]|uniref:GatB/YqeY domain-containing protein n=1 Tax=Vibrio phage pVp-1 TaxID=1150989 RepID=H6WXE9_9CAUD|nr:tRNA amidotransferase [Vibrio phage pVp-1]AFB83915.1 hypothetical protein pVp-1_0058 [Vibrio phage pVp-1]QQO38445.1 hypothetical protein VPG01_087 [Vibrio phage VPG01]
MQLDEMQAKLLEVRKAGNKVGRAVMQSLIADFDKQARTGKEVDGMALIRKYLDNAKTNMQLEVQRKNSAGAKAYGLEAAFLESLLPKQLTDEQLRNIIETGDFKNIGEVMKFLRFNYQGQYDGGVASKIAREVL